MVVLPLGGGEASHPLIFSGSFFASPILHRKCSPSSSGVFWRPSPWVWFVVLYSFGLPLSRSFEDDGFYGWWKGNWYGTVWVVGDGGCDTRDGFPLVSMEVGLPLRCGMVTEVGVPRRGYFVFWFVNQTVFSVDFLLFMCSWVFSPELDPVCITLLCLFFPGVGSGSLIWFGFAVLSYPSCSKADLPRVSWTSVGGDHGSGNRQWELVGSPVGLVIVHGGFGLARSLGDDGRKGFWALGDDKDSEARLINQLQHWFLVILRCWCFDWVGSSRVTGLCSSLLKFVQAWRDDHSSDGSLFSASRAILLWPHLNERASDACGCESHFFCSGLETAGPQHLFSFDLPIKIDRSSVARPCVVIWRLLGSHEILWLRALFVVPDPLVTRPFSGL